MAATLLPAFSPAKDGGAPIDREDQKAMSSRSFLVAHPDIRYRTEGWLAYEQGRHAEAILQFKRAASYADKPSQAMLAEMAWKGHGQAMDRPLAYAWADISAERGYRQFVQLREHYWSELTDEERLYAMEVGRPLWLEYSDEAAKPRLQKILRRARFSMAGGRPNRGATVIVPGPNGVSVVIRGHDFYAEKFWNPEAYQAWTDGVWKDPPKENVEVGTPTAVDAD